MELDKGHRTVLTTTNDRLYGNAWSVYLLCKFSDCLVGVFVSVGVHIGAHPARRQEQWHGYWKQVKTCVTMVTSMSRILEGCATLCMQCNLFLCKNQDIHSNSAVHLASRPPEWEQQFAALSKLGHFSSSSRTRKAVYKKKSGSKQRAGLPLLSFLLVVVVIFFL